MKMVVVRAVPRTVICNHRVERAIPSESAMLDHLTNASCRRCRLKVTRTQGHVVVDHDDNFIIGCHHWRPTLLSVKLWVCPVPQIY